MSMQNMIDCQERFKTVKNRIEEGKNWKSNILKDIEILTANSEYTKWFSESERNDIDLLKTTVEGILLERVEL